MRVRTERPATDAELVEESDGRSPLAQLVNVNILDGEDAVPVRFCRNRCS